MKPVKDTKNLVGKKIQMYSVSERKVVTVPVEKTMKRKLQNGNTVTIACGNSSSGAKVCRIVENIKKK